MKFENKIEKKVNEVVPTAEQFIWQMSRFRLVGCLDSTEKQSLSVYRLHIYDL